MRQADHSIYKLKTFLKLNYFMDRKSTNCQRCSVVCAKKDLIKFSILHLKDDPTFKYYFMKVGEKSTAKERTRLLILKRRLVS